MWNRSKYYSSFAGGAQPYRSGDVRREREIGDWGRASEHIGRRWEELGFERLVPLVEGHDRRWPHSPVSHRPLKAVPLTDPTVQSSIVRLGLPSPDVVVLLEGPEGVVLQPIDFKWDLEFASYDQIRACTLMALLERDPGPLLAFLVETAGQPLSGHSSIDGLLFAPDRHSNRLFLTSESNRRREYPVQHDEVIFAAVSPHEFFSPLPGWPMAVHLAGLDRSAHSIEQLEGAERYYRLGAGLLGATAKLATSIFDLEIPEIDAVAAMRWLEQSAASRRLNTQKIIEHVNQLVLRRAVPVARLKQLTKSPCRPSDIQRMLTRSGTRVVGWDAAGANHQRDILRRVGAEHRHAVMRAGAALVRKGLSDEEALSRLEVDMARLNTATRVLAERLVLDLVGTR